MGDESPFFCGRGGVPSSCSEAQAGAEGSHNRRVPMINVVGGRRLFSTERCEHDACGVKP